MRVYVATLMLFKMDIPKLLLLSVTGVFQSRGVICTICCWTAFHPLPLFRKKMSQPLSTVPFGADLLPQRQRGLV